MPRFAADKLVGYAAALLQAAGLAPARARTVAEILVEGDLFGHTTHGLQLLPGYLKEIDSGAMAVSGDPETLADTGPAAPATSGVGWEDEVASDDDVPLEDSGLVGRAVVERVLGGRLLEERPNDA